LEDYLYNKKTAFMKLMIIQRLDLSEENEEKLIQKYYKIKVEHTINPL